MAYRYIAYTPDGNKIQGRLEAASESAAEELLWKQNYTVVSLKEDEEGQKGGLLAAKIKTHDLIVFSRQLATLIDSGIPITRSLQLLQEQADNKRLKEILAEVVFDVQKGRFFSEAIIKHGNAFPSLYGRLIEVGERAGNLSMVLRQLAVYMEKEEALVRKIRGAMAYPSFVLLMAFGVVVLMITFALPPLMEMFTAFDAELPLPTRILIAISDFAVAYKYHVLIGTAGAVLVLLIFLRTEPGRVIFHRLLLKTPLIGVIVIRGAVARMCRSMSTLLQAGISLPEIMELIIRTQGNRILRRALEDVHNKLLQGHGLSDPLASQKLFPTLFVQMVHVGEETGSLDANLETLANFYEEEVDRAVAALTGAMTPALTIFIGILVAFVAVAVIMPMYSLMGNIQ